VELGEEGYENYERATRGGRRALSWEDSIFFVLLVCRTGWEQIDVAPLFHIKYSTACRYWLTYMQFLKVWLAEEYPHVVYSFIPLLVLLSPSQTPHLVAGWLQAAGG
jgi:hypothetical protein